MLSELEDIDSMILMVGLSGSGKSTFASMLANDPSSVKIGHQLESETKETSLYSCRIGHNKFFIVDTPGFDDTYMTDAEILDNISTVLACQYESGLKLKGVVFFQSIREIRVRHSTMTTFQLLKAIVGKDKFSDVVFVTTMWAGATEDQTAEFLVREEDLVSNFLSKMNYYGSAVQRFYGDRPSAEVIVSSLLGKRNVVLAIQEELCVERKPLMETSAGAIYFEKVQRDVEMITEELQEARQSMARAKDRRQLKQETMEYEDLREKLGKREKVKRLLEQPVGQMAAAKKTKAQTAMMAGQVFAWLLAGGSFVVNMLGFMGVC